MKCYKCFLCLKILPFIVYFLVPNCLKIPSSQLWKIWWDSEQIYTDNFQGFFLIPFYFLLIHLILISAPPPKKNIKPAYIFIVFCKTTLILFFTNPVCICITDRRSTFEFPSRGQPFRSQFVLYLALWTGLTGATRLTRSDFMLHLGWIHFY